MGIVNVTPDSFSDGGRYFDPQKAVAHAQQLVAEGADIIDIGGESTRPGATPVPPEEEMRRVVPVIEHLSKVIKVPISVDTMKVEVAAQAIAAGAAIINDVAANRNDPAMWHLAALSSAGYVCMHMQGTPQTMQANPSYTNVVPEVNGFFQERLRLLGKAGVAANQVLLDPGMGFGKTLAHNLQLIASLREFTKLERPLLIGVSRKSFLAKVGGGQSDNRLPAALACAVLALEAGASVIRTHDAAETIEAVRMSEAIIAKRNACPETGTPY